MTHQVRKLQITPTLTLGHDSTQQRAHPLFQPAS